MNKSLSIGLLLIVILTVIAAFNGCFQFFFSSYNFVYILNIEFTNCSIFLNFYLNSAILMLGMGIGIISIFTEKKKKLWFNSSVLIILIGTGIISLLYGYKDPIIINNTYPFTNLNSFFTMFASITFNNIFMGVISIITGPTIIFPYSFLSKISLNSSYFLGELVSHYGLKGVLLFCGMFHIYPELFALYLASISGIKVSLMSFKSFTCIKRNGITNSLRKIKDELLSEILNTLPKVVILLVIAALLETLWGPFWINYWLQHIL